MSTIIHMPTDDEIRDMLRPLTAVERSAKAIPILSYLAKYGELPSSALIKIFQDTNVCSMAHSPMLALTQEKYVNVRVGSFRGSRCRFFKITPKGRAALKAHKQ